MINKLRDLLSENIILPIHFRGSLGNFILMKEDGYNSAIKKLIIYGIPDNSIIISLDICTNKMNSQEKLIYSRLNHYLRKECDVGVNKRCDLTIFFEQDDSLHIISIDLKSKDPDIESSAIQLKNSEIYIKYLIELLTSFYDFNNSVYYYKALIDARSRKKTTNNLTRLQAIKSFKGVLEKYNIKEISFDKFENQRVLVHFKQFI